MRDAARKTTVVVDLRVIRGIADHDIPRGRGVVRAHRGHGGNPAVQVHVIAGTVRHADLHVPQAIVQQETVGGHGPDIGKLGFGPGALIPVITGLSAEGHSPARVTAAEDVLESGLAVRRVGLEPSDDTHGRSGSGDIGRRQQGGGDIRQVAAQPHVDPRVHPIERHGIRERPEAVPGRTGSGRQRSRQEIAVHDRAQGAIVGRDRQAACGR